MRWRANGKFRQRNFTVKRDAERFALKVENEIAERSTKAPLIRRVLVASSRQADLGAVWEVVRDAFGDHDVPSTLLGVTVLGYDDQLVEIEALAAAVD